MKYIRFFLLIIALSVTLFSIYAASVNLLVHNSYGEYHELEIGDGVSMSFNDSTLSINVDSIPLTYEIGDVVKLTYSVHTDVREIALKPAAAVTADGIELSYPGEHSVVVVDLAGRVLINDRFNDTFRIRHSVLPCGVVIVKVDSQETLKLMVR